MTQKTLFTVAILSGFAALGYSPAIAAITKEDEKKAAAVASNEADKWAASQKAPEPPKPEPTPPPVAAATAVPAAENKKTETPKEPATETKAEPKPESKPAAKPQPAATLPAKPAAPKIALNEMVGKINAIENDARVLRLSLEGGYSIEFTYDHSTVITNGGGAIKDTDLAYGDKVQVRYAGKDLKALEIERLEKAPRTISE